MSNRRLLALGYILFAVSFLFIFGGFYLDFEKKSSVSDPIKDIIVIAGSDDNIIISTTDDTEEKPSDEEIVNGDDLSSLDSNSSSNNNSEVIPVPEPEPEPVPPTSPTIPSPPDVKPIDDENNILRRKIEDTYGIKVKYGAETDGYSAGSMEVISIVDSTIVQSGLKQLNSALSLYPRDFFKEFLEVNLSLEVFLIQRYSAETVTGITDLSGNKVIISIAMDYPFIESFNHEVYHYIEHFIERKNGEFSVWNTYNPVDFIYGLEANPNYSFNRTGLADAPFVNNYAQTNADEDRASTFEYMTADNRAICFNSIDYPIWKKSSYMALMIETYFDTVSSSVVDYWERFIY